MKKLSAITSAILLTVWKSIAKLPKLIFGFLRFAVEGVKIVLIIFIGWLCLMVGIKVYDMSQAMYGKIAGLVESNKQAIEDFVEEQRKLVTERYERERNIKVLESVFSNLDSERTVLTAECLETTRDGKTKIRVLCEPSGKTSGSVRWINNVEVEGERIYFDFLTMNFALSEIGNGTIENIAIPNKIYGDLQAPDNVASLLANARRQDGDGLYSELPEEYARYVERLLTDSDYAKSMGVRAVHATGEIRRMSKGDKLEIVVYGLGGLGEARTREPAGIPNKIMLKSTSSK